MTTPAQTAPTRPATKPAAAKPAAASASYAVDLTSAAAQEAMTSFIDGLLLFANDPRSDHSWLDEAACAQDPNLSAADFFPRAGVTATQAAGMATCRTCPVRRECAEALTGTEFLPYGIRGGTSGRSLHIQGMDAFWSAEQAEAALRDHVATR